MRMLNVTSAAALALWSATATQSAEPVKIRMSWVAPVTRSD